MEFALWAYPWDLRDGGIAETATRLAELGIDEVNLATNYHTVHSFSPTNSDRKSYFARASAYIQPNDEYGKLTPVPAEHMGDDNWVREVSRTFDETSIAVNSWTVGCHNSRLGLQHPEEAIMSPHGDPLVFGLCPSRPAVQTYLVNLVDELASNYPFNRIELETFDYFYGSGLSWHHDKVFVELGKLGTLLLGLCFCEHCRRKAADAGVAVERVREVCIETIADIVAGHLPAPLDPLTWLRSHPEVAAYLEVREATLGDLYADLRDTVTTDLGYYIGILDVGDEWMFGADLDQLAPYVDYYTVLAYEETRTAAVNRVRTAQEIASGTPIHVGIQPGPPVIDDEDALRNVVDGVVDAGVERVSFYNYGPLPERSLDWIGRIIDAYG